MEKIITYENLRKFAYSNDKICKKPIRGIVVYFFGLGHMTMFNEDHDEAQYYGERGILYVMRFTHRSVFYSVGSVDYFLYRQVMCRNYSRVARQNVSLRQFENVTRNNVSAIGVELFSAAHNALDHYGIYWIPEYVKLAELTGNPMWRERARALWYSGTKLLSDGTLVIRNRVRPVGAQDESVRHTRWGRIDQRYFIPVEHCTTWQGVFRYETMRRLGGDLDLLR